MFIIPSACYLVVANNGFILRKGYRKVNKKNRRSFPVVERTVLVWYNNPINVKKEKEYVYLQVSKQ